MHIGVSAPYRSYKDLKVSHKTGLSLKAFQIIFTSAKILKREGGFFAKS